MTIWHPHLDRTAGPLYLGIADTLQQDIDSGRLPPGTRLPTHRALAETLGVTVGTVSRAYAEAESRGLLSSTVGRGTFTHEPSAAQAEAEHGPIELSVNRPAMNHYLDDLSGSLTQLANREDLLQCTLYQPRGKTEHRASAAQWLREFEGFEARAEQTLITNGAQHALFTSLNAVLRAGDKIAVEQLTYGGIKAIASQQQLEMVGIAMDEHGLLPEALDAACRQGGIRALVCQPNLQNPCSLLMPLARREAIVEVARRHDLWIIEDSVYGFLVEDKPPPFAALAPERSFHVNSISKSMVPGLRIGFVHAPVRMVAAVSAAARATVWMAAPLLVELFAQWVSDGTGRRRADYQRREARARQQLLVEILGQHRLQSHPDALHAWLLLPDAWRADDFARAAEQRGVLVNPSGVFTTRRDDNPAAVRLCLGGPLSRERLREGLEIVAELLESPAGALLDTL